MKIKQIYLSEYNYYLAMLPEAYRKLATLDKFIKDRNYENLYKMQANDVVS